MTAGPTMPGESVTSAPVGPVAVGSAPLTPDAGEPVPDQGSSPAVPTLRESLAGIHLPCDLLPVAPRSIVPGDDTLSLATSAASAEVVGPAIADELERLGYDLDPVSSSRLVARRGLNQLTLDMVLSAADVIDDSGPVYPELSPDAVLIVIRTGERS